MSRILIFGGSFDPITHGHIATAHTVMNLLGPNGRSPLYDELWLMPCYSHMWGKDMAPPLDRLRMCVMTTAYFDNIQTCDYEIVAKHQGSTYEFMQWLLENDEEGNTYGLLIGSDQANLMSKWGEWKKLVTEFQFVVAERKDYPLRDGTWYMDPKHIVLMDVKEAAGDVSSTMVRQQIKENGRSPLVLPEVLDYILRRELYVQAGN